MDMPTLYVNMLGTSNYVIKEKTEGLTHADSMLQLPFPGNCMNWILGHLMVYRMQCLGNIDGVSKADEDELALYGFGSEPMTDPRQSHPARKRCWRVSMISPSRSEPRSKRCPNPAWDDLLDEEQGVTVAQRLHFNLVYHEAYHVGQLEPLYELAIKNRS